MLKAQQERDVLAQRLREFAGGTCTFTDVEELAFDIRDRWSVAPEADLPPESDGEAALWNAVWDITASCRESLVSDSDLPNPVLEHIAYLDGAEPVPEGTIARRP
jgi:hypothetical protein